MCRDAVEEPFNLIQPLSWFRRQNLLNEVAFGESPPRKIWRVGMFPMPMRHRWEADERGQNTTLKSIRFRIVSLAFFSALAPFRPTRSNLIILLVE